MVTETSPPNCVFCNQPCRQVRWYKGKTENYCVSCNVDYLGPDNHSSKIKFRTMIKGFRYELMIDTITDTTVLGCWEAYNGFTTGAEPDTFKVLVESPAAIKGVTPSNLEDKIQTLLMFS